MSYIFIFPLDINEDLIIIPIDQLCTHLITEKVDKEVC